MTESEAIITWIQWIFLLFAEIFCIYMLAQFVMNRNEYHIRVRVPTLTYIYCLAAILMPLGRMFLEPHNCPFTYCQLKNDGTYTQSPTVTFLNSIVFASRVILLGTAFSMKLWYLYYVLKLQILFLNGKWWVYINEKLNENWWMKNMKKYGTVNKRMWIILISIMCTTIILSIFGAAVNPKIPLMISLLIIILTAVGMITFFCKIPKMNDIYGIKQEIKMATIFSVTAYLWFPITEFVSGGDEKIFALSIVNGIMNVILVPGMVWSVTIYPHKLFVKTYKKYSDEGDNIDNMEMGSNTISGFSEFGHDHDRKRKEGDWISVVSQDIDVLNVFMRFLCRSFCVESMLFLIETGQLKQEFIRKSDDDEKQTRFDCGTLIKLYDEDKNKDAIPKSTIVYNDNDEYNLNEQIRKIYDKYIDENAMLQINISASVRNAMQTIILNEHFAANQDVGSLIKIFDAAIEEIIAILTGAFWRFQSQSEHLLRPSSDVNEQIVIALQKCSK